MGLEQRIHEIGGVVVLAVHPAHAGQRLGEVGALVHLIGTGGAGVHLLQQIKVGILLLQEGTDRRKVLGQALLAPCTRLGAAVHEEAVIGLVGAEADVIGDHGIDGAALRGVCVMLRRQRHIAQPVVIDENIRHISAHQQHNSQQDTQRDLQPFFHTYVPPLVYNFSSA